MIFVIWNVGLIILNVLVVISMKIGMYFRETLFQHSPAYFYAPNFGKVGDILVSACMCVCVCVCMGHGDIALKLHVWIPHGKLADAYFWFSLTYIPLLNYGPLTNKGMQFCKCRISKSI